MFIGDREQHDALREKLNHFYETTADYNAFHGASAHHEPWQAICAAVNKLSLRCKPLVRVLEVGAGVSGFRSFLTENSQYIHYSVQDVTAQNEAFLKTVADKVYIGSVSDINDGFDIIFSTYVVEHISDPEEVYAKLWECLNPGGSLFIFCPRYDVPGYLSRSTDHLRWWRRAIVALTVSVCRLTSIISGKPRFLVHDDPAILHLPFARDRDAVHWVSLIDIRQWFKNKGSINSISLSSRGVKDWIVKNMLTVSVEIKKPLAR